MASLDQTLMERLDRLRDQGLLRRVRPVSSVSKTRLVADGSPVLSFASNDYLGLASDPRLAESAMVAMKKFGAGASASRLISGSVAIHQDLESALADYKGTEAALVFSSGHAAAVGAIPALVGSRDIVILDHLAHACLIDGARLSGARLRVFAHNDLHQFRQRLAWACAEREKAAAAPDQEKVRILVVTESLFSMDGDFAPLREIAEDCAPAGAWLFVDEAHSTGVCDSFGEEQSGPPGKLPCDAIRMGTLGKALGSVGGFIAGSKVLADYLVNHARSMLFSTAPAPSASAAALRALQIVQSSEGQMLRRNLWSMVGKVSSALSGRGGASSPIIPVAVGEEGRAMDAASRLWESGIWVPAIRYPTVPRGKARLRVSLSAAHEGADLDKLIEGLRLQGLT